MSQTLYLLKDELMARTTGWNARFFGVQPTKKGSPEDFHSLKRKVGLKTDFGWGEVQHLETVFEKADIWKDFPAQGLKFIAAEIRAGEEDQRIDLLYLQEDGGLYPCELKLGGTSLDTHGQIIRYIADLSYQEIDADWLWEVRKRYLVRRGTTREDALKIARHELHRHLRNSGIGPNDLHMVRNAGILVDEGFKPQLLKAVRYLNEFCGFSLRMLQMNTFVGEDWNVDAPEFRARIDIVELQ